MILVEETDLPQKGNLVKIVGFFDYFVILQHIVNANLSDLEIEGAQIGGAFIHNIGGPPPGHPMHDPNFRQRPVRFEYCDLNDSTFTHCDLSRVSISECNLSGMRINGISVDALLTAYDNK